ncbi:MAG: TetR/AcrR family transcriptional regulator [Acidimicrobiales bacterium]
MSPKTERRSRQGHESRLRIIEATFEIAAELGYAGTSIGKVSERSGLPASSVYWHFANKDELFAEVIQHSFDEWNASFPDPVPPDDRQQRPAILRQNCRDLVASVSSSPEFWRLGLMLALESQPVEPTARRRFLKIRRIVLERLADFWRAALPPESGRSNPELPARLARFTMAASDGIFVAAQAEGGDDLAALAELLADSLEALAIQHG